jgi:hypothetical protein
VGWVFDLAGQASAVQSVSNDELTTWQHEKLHSKLWQEKMRQHQENIKLDNI